MSQTPNNIATNICQSSHQQIQQDSDCQSQNLQQNKTNVLQFKGIVFKTCVIISTITTLALIFVLIFISAGNKQIYETIDKLQTVMQPKAKYFYNGVDDYLHKNNLTQICSLNKLNNISFNKQYIKQQNIKSNNSLECNEITEQIDWIKYYWPQKKQNEIISDFIKISELVKFGISIHIKNHYMLFQQNKVIKKVQEILISKNISYNQILSLNLRLFQGDIVLMCVKDLFKTIKMETLPLQKPIKNLIAIQTVAKMEQNIPYLRQWIGYHINLGIDKIFIYDNTGSIGQKIYGANVSFTKYGFDFKCLNYTQQQVTQEWESIWQQFYDHIIYVPWQPIDVNGNIVYNQQQSIKQYAKNFKQIATYTAFIDLDQMIFSQQNLNLSQFLLRKTQQGYTIVRMKQKKYVNRLCRPNKLLVEIQEFYDIDTKGWAQKQIIQTKKFLLGPSIHQNKAISGKQYRASNEQLHFNHMSLVVGDLIFAQNQFNATNTRLSRDSSTLKYKDVMKKICKDRCSENFSVICNFSDDQGRFRCPKYGKDYIYTKKL